MDAELRNRIETSLGNSYRLEHELVGGMARVFVAEDTSLGRKVVVKVLPPELSAEVSVERFRREILFAAQLQHPLIVPVLSAAQHGDLLYYTMPLVVGESLRARLLREGALPLGDVLRIWRDVVTALAFAHARDVMHRDIKPENILLTESAHDGGGEYAAYALVTDFGIARAIDTAVTSNGLTATGIAVGTPAYMAPEQIAGDPNIDPRADVYAAGAVAYEMLTGQQLFPGLSPRRMLAAHVTRHPEPITQIRPSIPEEVETLVQRCLAKEPNERPSSAELRREVEALLAEETTALLGSRRAGTAAGAIDGRASGNIAPASSGPVAQSSTSSPARMWRRVAVVAVSGALVVAAIAPFMLRTRQTVAPTASPRTARLGPRSVIVMPFENSSSEKDMEYLVDGVTDELIGALARVPGLRVSSRSTSFAFKASRLSARAIGDSLGVQLILTGSVRKAGDALRIVAQLIRATDDSTLWSDTYDRELRNVFKVQEELAQSVLAQLTRTIGPGQIATAGAAPVQLVRRTTVDREAYFLYLRGRSFWNRRTPDGFRRGAAYFDQAIARDSTYAAAWAGKADSYCILANFGIEPASKVCPLAAKAALRAMALDSTLAEAHASLGFVDLFYYWDFDAASRELGRAIALDSTYANAYLWRHQLNWARGDTAAMLADMKKAVDLEPLSLILATRYGGALLRAGRRKDAATQFRRTVEIDSTFGDVRGYLGSLMITEGNVDEGLREIERTRDPFQRAVAYARVGRRDDAVRLVHEIEASSRGGSWVSPLRIARMYGALGEADSALEWLERAYTARDPDMVFLASDGLGTIRNTDPRLRAFTSRIGAGGAGVVR